MRFLQKTLLLALINWMGWIGWVGAAEVGVTDDSILIGMTAPFSGPSGPYGLDMKGVIAAYFKQINDAGGINGRKLQLVAMDDGYETDRAVSNTKTLINDKKVFAMLASYGSSTTTAAMNDAFGPAKVPLIGTISGAGSLRQALDGSPNNRYMFNVRASYANETEAIVNQLHQFGIKKIGVFYQNDGFGKSGLEGVIAAMKKHNMEPSVVATIERNSIDVSAAVQIMSKVEPQAVVMVTLYKATAEFVRQMKKAGKHPQFTTLSPVGADLLIKDLGNDARGIGICQVMPYPWDDTIQMVREYHKLIGGKDKVSYYGIEAYAMAKVMVDGIRKSGANLTREKLISTLENMHNHDIGGYRVSYSGDQRLGSRYVDLTVIGTGGRVLH